MKAKIALPYDEGVFAVPVSLITEHLKMTPPIAFKIAFFLACNPKECYSEGELSSQLKLSPTEVEEAILHLISVGIVSDTEKAVENTPSNIKETEFKNVVIKSNREHKLSRVEIAQKLSESDNLKFLHTKAEEILSRNLAYHEIGSLIAVTEQTLMPPEVVLYVLSYCKAKSKTSIRAIEKEIFNWHDSGILTLDKAEKHLIFLNHKNDAEGKVRSLFGITDRKFSAKEKAFIADWIIESRYSSDLIREGYNRSVDSTGKVSFAYINKVLKNWEKQGITNTKELASLEKPKETKSSSSSIDYDFLDNDLK